MTWVDVLNSHLPGPRQKLDGDFPLCPLLFSQAIETLARKICNNSQIQGINTEGVESRISLRADDTLLYITKPGTSAPAASDLIEECGFAAGYKISPNTRLQGRNSFLWESKTFSHVNGATMAPACLESK